MFIPADTFYHSTAKCLLLRYIFSKIMTFHISSLWLTADVCVCVCVCKEPPYEMNQLSSKSVTNTSYCDMQLTLHAMMMIQTLQTINCQTSTK